MQFVEYFALGSIFVFVLYACKLLTNFNGNVLLSRLLAFSILARAFQNLFGIFIINNSITHNMLLANILPIITFSIAPVTYIYVRSFVNDETKLRKSDLFHLIPIFLLILNMLPSYGISAEAWTMSTQQVLKSRIGGAKSYFLLPVQYVFLIRNLISFIYLSVAWWVIYKSVPKKLKLINKDKNGWLFLYLGISTALAIISVLIAILFFKTEKSLISIMKSYYILPVAMLLNYIYISYIINSPSVLYGNLLSKSNLPLAQSVIVELSVGNSIVKECEIPNAPLLPANMVDIYFKSLNESIVINQLFLNPELTINDLAEVVSMPVHHISYILNQCKNKNFREYINEYRINCFIENYHSSSSNLTIEAMALESGFKSRATFHRAFKLQTGQTTAGYFNSRQ